MKSLMLYIKALLDRYIYLVPIFMLLITLVTNFVDYNKGVYNYVVLGNGVGYSIATNIVFFYHFNFTNKHYCWFTRKTPIGLLLVNVIDMIGFYMRHKDYSCIFNIVICSIIIILAMIFKIKTSIAND